MATGVKYHLTKRSGLDFRVDQGSDTYWTVQFNVNLAGHGVRAQLRQDFKQYAPTVETDIECMVIDEDVGLVQFHIPFGAGITALEGTWDSEAYNEFHVQRLVTESVWQLSLETTE